MIVFFYSQNITVLSFILQHGQSRFTTMGETGYVDHDLSPPWTLLNIAKELKFGLFIEPPEQHTIERNIAF